jgi:hypothetical protein
MTSSERAGRSSQRRAPWRQLRRFITNGLSRLSDTMYSVNAVSRHAVRPCSSVYDSRRTGVRIDVRPDTLPWQVLPRACERARNTATALTSFTVHWLASNPTR